MGLRCHRQGPGKVGVTGVALEGELPEGYLDIYKLAVEMADRVSSRKAIVNTFFLTLNTALFTGISVAKFPWYADAAGLLFAMVWWSLLLSYKALNRAKFKVINDMEKKLPAQIYTDEWGHLGERVNLWRHPRRWMRSYREIGSVERYVPLIFALAYAVLAVVHR